MEIIEKTQTICKVKDLNPGDIFKYSNEYFIKAYFDTDAFSLISYKLGYFETDDKVVKYDTAKLELN